MNISGIGILFLYLFQIDIIMIFRIANKAFFTHFFIVTLALFAVSIPLQAQIMTQPLFMQIKTPQLESYSGIQIEPYGNVYHINPMGKDSVDISFIISVPKEMLSEKWAISLTPTVYSKFQDGRLKDVVVKGWKFAEKQEDNYDKYSNFVNSIVDTSLYEKMFIDQKRLEKEIEHQHDVYWQFYYDEWERQIEYEKWKSQQDGSIQTFSLKEQSKYSDQLYAQYRLRIENQSKRYIRANMDTTGLTAKYMNEFRTHNAKMPRYFVNENIALTKVPKKFKDIYQSKRTLQDITDSMLELLVKRDSALMALPVLDYSRIVENEKKTIRQSNIQQDLIQLPKNENALLDTTIYDIRSDYRYLYTYRYAVPSAARDSIKVQLTSKILATDGSGFSANSEDTIIYVISPTLHIAKPREAQTPNRRVKESKRDIPPRRKSEDTFLRREKNDDEKFLQRLNEKLEEKKKVSDFEFD